MALEDRIRLPALNLIHRRSRLLDMLTTFVEEGKRLITIYAPGGYGKSILLADFAQTTDLPICWCSLESADRDPTSFLTLLAYSIADRFQTIETDSLLRLVARGDTQASVHHLAELLTTVGPHIIIIDDYHKAVSAGMTLALNRLLQRLPESSTVIVAARGDMTLETGQIIELLIADQAAGLSEVELRFTGQEIQRVMQKRFGRQIGLDQAAEIANATDGNIAQILLAGHITHAERILGNLQQRLGDDREMIYRYLAEEVLDKQPASLQQFMLYTSVLPDMTVELSNELLEISDAETFLENLKQNDLFIAQIGAGYRYHDLFAEFLRGKLAQDDETYLHVAKRAATLLANQGRTEEAVDLYLSVRAWGDAAELLERQGRFFYDTGRALTLNHWFSQLSKEDLAQYPRLQILRGRILHNDLGEPQQALDHYQQAEKQFHQQKDLVGVAETQVLKSTALRMMGRANEAVTLATSALDQLESLSADDRLIAWAIRARGITRGTAGDFLGALADARRALALFERLDDTYWVGICHHEIGVILVAQGNVHGADYHYRQAIKIWESLGNANDLANTLNSLGVSLYRVGEYEESLKYFNDSLDVALQIGVMRRAAFAQAGIGDAYLGKKDYGRALEAFTTSTEFARQAEVRSLEIYNLVKVGECFFRQGNLAKALDLADRARGIASETGLAFEQGLAVALQAQIYVRQAEYGTSFDLFAKAVDLARSDLVEVVKIRLWWGFSLILASRAVAAFEQLQEAIKLALTLGELIRGLGPTIEETRPLLLHFLNRVDTPPGVSDSIQLLLGQTPHRIEFSQPALQIFALGVPTLIVAGERKQFSQRGKIRKLPEFLLYLTLEGKSNGCRWAEVAAALWPDLEPNKASTTFHQTLKRLRDVIFENPDYIVVEADYYQINPQFFEWCDALTFEELFERMVTMPPAEGLALQYELISLYQGEFLDGFELGEWGSLYRAKYELRFLQAVKLAAEQLLKRNEPREALTIVNKGLAQDYFREDLHRLALRAYAELGFYDQLAAHQTELIEIYQREFGGPPEPETEQLFADLLAQR